VLRLVHEHESFDSTAHNNTTYNGTNRLNTRKNVVVIKTVVVVQIGSGPGMKMRHDISIRVVMHPEWHCSPAAARIDTSSFTVFENTFLSRIGLYSRLRSSHTNWKCHPTLNHDQ